VREPGWLAIVGWAKDEIERLAEVPAECDIASEFRYRHPVSPKKFIVHFHSRKRRNCRLPLAAVRLAKSAGGRF